MQVFIHYVGTQKTTDGVTKSNGTLGYIHWPGERLITRLPMVCLKLRPMWMVCLSLELLESVVRYALFRSVEVKGMQEEF